MMATDVTLSLISHTNVGKTTLARTLLRRDVGEVLDRAHVTDTSEAFTLIETEDARLRLWDTPGFGDTARLMRRLRRADDPLGWFLHQVWDRIVDRPLWCSQEAVRNVRDEADVVLYLVNASENPEEAGYVPLELEILDWMKRPVILMLNQVGREGQKLVARWRDFVAGRPSVREVLSLDAFTRCWVEEGVLLGKVERALEGPKRVAMHSLTAAWNEANLELFRSSCGAMAGYLLRAARDRESPGRGEAARGTLGRLGEALKFSAVDRKRAMKSLNERLDRATRELMDRLIDAHGLTGTSASKIEQNIQDFEVRGGGAALDERSGALLGGAISGALGGLAADALSGGLSLGGGMIAGGILGALGGAAVGAGYRIVKGEQAPAVTWSTPFLDRLCRQVLLRYLAVAHFGRGQGDYRDLDRPDRWSAAVEETLYRQRETIQAIWSAAERHSEGAEEGLCNELKPVIERAARDVLLRAYPHAGDLLS
jgi:hypothetical protein